MLSRPEAVLEDVSEQLGSSVESRAALQKEIAEYRQRLRDKEKESDRLVTAYRRGLIAERQLARQQKDLQGEERALRGYLADLEARVVTQTDAANRSRDIAALISKYQAELSRSDTFTFEERRAIWCGR